MNALTLLDGSLAAALLFSAWRAVRTADGFQAIVFFFVFGLLMALCWVRLDAPDVALAEAAIGAGITGGLFLAAFSRISRAWIREEPGPPPAPPEEPGEP